MGLSLTLERVRELAREYALIPLCLDVIADLETPVTAYLKVARGSYSFLLESVEGGERLARYSFIGTEPYRVATTRGLGDHDPLGHVRVNGDLDGAYEAATKKIDRLVERLGNGYSGEGEYARTPFPNARRGPV